MGSGSRLPGRNPANQTTYRLRTLAGNLHFRDVRHIGAALAVAMSRDCATLVEGNGLIVELEPKGLFRYFDIPPGRQFIIDGQTKSISDLRPGTVLTATATTTTQPVIVRTTSVINGTVWYVSGNYVILELPSGENREYNVPPSFRFNVEGRPASVTDLRKGMKVSAEKIVAEPRTEISTRTVITGKAPR